MNVTDIVKNRGDNGKMASTTFNIKSFNDMEETGYEGGGMRRKLWWRKTATINKLSATLKYISAGARERRWKSGRRGGGGGDRDAEESEDGAGSDDSRDAGAETGDAQVGK